MEYRALGRTGMSVSYHQLRSVGDWRILGHVNDEESMRTLHAALDAA